MRRALWIALLALGAVESSGLAQVSFGVNNIKQVQATQSSQENCEGLRDTLSSLASPSKSNRYLIRLEPGAYYCHTTPLILPPGVIIEGTGPRVTRIQGSVDNPLLGVVHLVEGTELRSLSVFNSENLPGPGPKTLAVSAWEFVGVPFVQLKNVKLHGFSDQFVSVGALNAVVWISSSNVLGPISAEAGSYVEVSYSYLYSDYSVDASSQVRCRFSTDGSAVGLDSFCQP